MPVTPALAPKIAAGLPLSTEPRGGRDAQSMAFFNTPGTPWLYSGVAMSSASASAMARLGTPPTGSGSPGVLDVLVVERDLRQAVEDADLHAPRVAAPTAARSNARLYDFCRRLPAMPQTSSGRSGVGRRRLRGCGGRLAAHGGVDRRLDERWDRRGRRCRGGRRGEDALHLREVLAVVRVEQDGECLPVEALHPRHRLERAVGGGALDDHLHRRGGGHRIVVAGGGEQRLDVAMDGAQLGAQVVPVAQERRRRLQARRDRVLDR